MDRRLLPLLLASDEATSPSEVEPLDRLRMQKGVFLMEMRGSPAWREMFKFQPYDWGPYSFELASTLTELLDDGLLVKEPVPNRRYMRYRTTEKGESVLAGLEGSVSVEERTFVRKVRSYVGSRSFARLLREVYKAYPDFAVNSRFSG